MIVCYTKAQVDILPVEHLLEMPIETKISDFDKEKWRSAWFECVEVWWEDGEGLYDVMLSGFKGFLDRTGFEIYCDIRFTHDLQGKEGWDEVAESADDLGKYS